MPNLSPIKMKDTHGEVEIRVTAERVRPNTASDRLSEGEASVTLFPEDGRLPLSV